MKKLSLKKMLGILGTLAILQTTGFAQTAPSTTPSPQPTQQRVEETKEVSNREQAPANETARPAAEAEKHSQEPKTAKRKDLTPVIHFRDF